MELLLVCSYLRSKVLVAFSLQTVRCTSANRHEGASVPKIRRRTGLRTEMSISILALAEAPARAIGIYFFSPVIRGASNIPRVRKLVRCSSLLQIREGHEHIQRVLCRFADVPTKIVQGELLKGLTVAITW